MRLSSWRRQLSALVLIVAAGCGPSLYAARIRPAARAVERARSADAAEHAPYEYHYAVEHLDKAREEAGESNWQDAMDYAETAEEFATKAREMSRQRMRGMGR